MNIVIIQARMASTRLPGKCMRNVGNHRLISLVLNRASQIVGVTGVLVATSLNPENDILADHVTALGYEVFRGDEDDVISRFYEVAKRCNAETIIRLTGDNPLIDSEAMSQLLKAHNEHQNDYSCIYGFPVGAVGDVFSFRAIEESHLSGIGRVLCDHVDLFVLENSDRFKLMCWNLSPNLMDYRLTIDDDLDLNRIRCLMKCLDKQNVGLEKTNTHSILQIIHNFDLERLMKPRVSSVSEANQHTANLVKGIKLKKYILLDELGCFTL